MLLTRWISAGALALFVGAGGSARASTLTYTATLSGLQETPPNASSATGFATLTLTGDILTVTESYTGLTAPPSAAHIHCCTAPGVSAPVVIPFLMFPLTTSGTYMTSFDLSSFLFPAGVTEGTFLAGLNSGMAYVNIHDSNYSGGEIRGQILGMAPEPGSLVLLATGAAAMCGALRRRLRG